MGGGVKLYSYLTKKREEIDGCKKEKGNTVVSLFIDEFYFHLFEDVEYPSLHSAEDQSFTLHPFAFLSFHVHQCALEFILHDSLVSLPLFSPSFSILPFPSLPSSFLHHPSFPFFQNSSISFLSFIFYPLPPPLPSFSPSLIHFHCLSPLYFLTRRNKNREQRSRRRRKKGRRRGRRRRMGIESRNKGSESKRIRKAAKKRRRKKGRGKGGRERRRRRRRRGRKGRERDRIYIYQTNRGFRAAEGK